VPADRNAADGSAADPSTSQQPGPAGPGRQPEAGRPHVFGIAGWSGSGKTTLIEQLIPRLRDAGLRVSLIKHAHHAFDVDHPGKDSYRHRHAGCSEVLITSSVRWALMHELRGAPEPTLEESLAWMSPCDLVLVEGFKRAPIPKLEVYRPAIGKPPLHPDDPHICAIATDAPIATRLPVFDLSAIGDIATFVLSRLGFAPLRVD
jgi:molybdopterin-guanine dinucleotide biosynthesis protein B